MILFKRNTCNRPSLLFFSLSDYVITDEDESRLTGPNAPQILKCIASKQLACTTLDSPMKDVVENLLDALIVKYSWNADESMGSS